MMPRTVKTTLTASGWRVLVLLLLTVLPWGVGVVAMMIPAVNQLRH